MAALEERLRKVAEERQDLAYMARKKFFSPRTLESKRLTLAYSYVLLYSLYSYYIQPGQGCCPAMRIRLQNELLLLNILAVLLIIIITFFPSNVLRIILGLPFVLFFPGYTLIAALFPRRTTLDSIERVALSFGLSIAAVPLIGLILNYTPWGIELEPILISITIFIIATSLIAWYRRHKLA